MNIDERVRRLLSRAEVLINNNPATSHEAGATFSDATQWLSDLRKLKKEYHNVGRTTSD